MNTELIDRYRYINVDDDNWWANFVVEDFIQDVAETHGIHIEPGSVEWRLGFCQSDGAWFGGYVLNHDFDKFMSATKFWDRRTEWIAKLAIQHGAPPSISITVAHRGGSCRGNDVEIEADDLDSFMDTTVPLIEALIDDWQNQYDEEMNWLWGQVKDLWNCLQEDLYRRLRDEYDHRTSDEAVLEAIKSSGLWLEKAPCSSLH